MSEYREAHEQARDFGLQKRHEERLRRLVPDAAVEDAFREANRRLRLDELSMHDTRCILATALPHLHTREARAVRKAVGEEIAQAVLTTCTRPDVCETCQRVATLAREIGSRDPA